MLNAVFTLIATQNPELFNLKDLNMVHFANNLKKGGLMVLGHVLQAEYNADTLAERRFLVCARPRVLSHVFHMPP